MPRVYNTLTRIHADPVRRRRVWCALSRLMGGAFASWHPEMFKDTRRQQLKEPDWFEGKECIGVPLSDYQAMDDTVYKLEGSNSVRACSIESLCSSIVVAITQLSQVILRAALLLLCAAILCVPTFCSTISILRVPKQP